ncbi:MAG: hypothetical protein P1P86_01050 [Bacteroidales bacterium]|nr:hypothetical protein [Bacteroidales bacterium]
MGILSSRTNHIFQTKAAKTYSLAFGISSGNIWLPYVRAYQPLNEADKDLMRSFVWNDRDYYFDQENSPSESMGFQADGIIRAYQLHLNIPLFNKHELMVNSRVFSLDGGRIPYSLLTSDRLIEWFHSNVAGGEDPFARKVYGMDQAYIRYTDEDGRTLEIDKGQFTFSGMDLNYTYYPEIKSLENHRIYTNFGMQLGLNASRYNSSLDVGLSTSLIKIIPIRNNRAIHAGAGLSAIYQNLILFGDPVHIRNRNALLSSEVLLSYIIPVKRSGCFSLALSYHIRSSMNKRKDFETIVLTGDRITSHWHYSISHFYKVLSANYLIISYSKGAFAYSIFLREDFSVDNAPDAQTGFGIKMSFK